MALLCFNVGEARAPESNRHTPHMFFLEGCRWQRIKMPCAEDVSHRDPVEGSAKSLRNRSDVEDAWRGWRRDRAVQCEQHFGRRDARLRLVFSFSRCQIPRPDSPLGSSEAAVFGRYREHLLLAAVVRCSRLPSRFVSIAPLLQLCPRLKLSGTTQVVSASCTACRTGVIPLAGRTETERFPQ